eukprot:TRINITY_DN574_c0_g1_i1.p1 TRINITY_DN574_c0_g1~~TRINITY_DN574_c0_g1_i1.p1  ORF type:complete len:492 (+),score=107.98 TRINITY_DN574_c0_g1_i1:141-1616(+)
MSDLEFKNSQYFDSSDTPREEDAPEPQDPGEEGDDHLLSAVAFDSTGDMIATGDKTGWVTIYERKETEPAEPPKPKPSSGLSRREKKVTPPEQSEYRMMTTFQSHTRGFDYLKSEDIEEKINKIRFWKPKAGHQHLLLSCNEKTIKLWRVWEKKVHIVGEAAAAAAAPGSSTSGTFRGPPPSSLPPLPPGSIPRLVVPQSRLSVACAPKRVYANGHTYHINSVSVCSDGETFLSADDLRINLWSRDVVNESFNIVDMKPPRMEDLEEVITAAEFHPHHCHVFMYSSSKGRIKLGDLRNAALCDQHAKVFERPDDQNNSFFSEIISTITDVKFSHDGRYILARDYMTLKLWDLHQDKQPLRTVRVHDHIEPKLCELYEGDLIFDKFECAFSNDDSKLLTGSYHDQFNVYERAGKGEGHFQASKTAPKRKQRPSLFPKWKTSSSSSTQATVPTKPPTLEQTDFGKKCLHLDWHPSQNTVAMASGTVLYVYMSQ